MAALSFAKDHNIGAYLNEDGPEIVGFRDIVRFLRRSNLFYSLTVSPIVYDQMIRDFWTSAQLIEDADVTTIAVIVGEQQVKITEQVIC